MFWSLEIPFKTGFTVQDAADVWQQKIENSSHAKKNASVLAGGGGGGYGQNWWDGSRIKSEMCVLGAEHKKSQIYNT